jgi:hypothetical protein
MIWRPPSCFMTMLVRRHSNNCQVILLRCFRDDNLAITKSFFQDGRGIHELTIARLFFTMLARKRYNDH